MGYAVEPKRHSKELGLKLIIVYKFVKAAAELGLGVTLLTLNAQDLVQDLQAVSEHIRQDATAAWSVSLAEQLVRAATEQHLRVLALASLFDAVLTAVEGWALHRWYRWSRWLVVVSTACLIPFEGIALVHHPSVTRSLLLLVNLLVVDYLIRRRTATSNRATLPAR